MLVWKAPNLGTWIFNHIPKLRKCVGIELIPHSPHEALEESCLSISTLPICVSISEFLFCFITWCSMIWGTSFFLTFFSFSFLFVLEQLHQLAHKIPSILDLKPTFSIYIIIFTKHPHQFIYFTRYFNKIFTPLIFLLFQIGRASCRERV